MTVAELLPLPVTRAGLERSLDALLTPALPPARKAEGQWSPPEALNDLPIQTRAFDYYRRLERVKTFVESHLAEEVTLESAARAALMETKYFSRFFREKVGLRFTDWVSLLRLRRSIELLSEANYTIAEVAFEVGFGDLRTFQRTFKKWIGMTPREFKKLVRPI